MTLDSRALGLLCRLALCRVFCNQRVRLGVCSLNPLEQQHRLGQSSFMVHSVMTPGKDLYNFMIGRK